MDVPFAKQDIIYLIMSAMVAHIFTVKLVKMQLIAHHVTMAMNYKIDILIQKLIEYVQTFDFTFILIYLKKNSPIDHCSSYLTDKKKKSKF